MRLVRGDQLAIPQMIERLAMDNKGHWWQCGRYIWSPELTKALYDFLTKRSEKVKRVWGEGCGADWIIYELLMRLPVDQAEKILLTHWEHLQFSLYYVQTALFFSTQPLLKAVNVSINDCPEPNILFKYLGRILGVRTKGRSGITSKSQIYALVPYLHFLDPMDVYDLWEVCNKQGFFSVRREFFDDRLQDRWVEFNWDNQRAFPQLDKMVAENHFSHITYWVDRFIKTDVSWDEIYATMLAWLQERRSFEALRIVAAAVKHRGTRHDMEMLMNYEGASETEEALALILDTEFAVRRRSIR